MDKRLFSRPAALLIPTLLLLSLAPLGGCGKDGVIVVERGGASPPEIPPAYLPPHGKCRIWFPGRDPAAQPPAGECRDLEQQVPEGALLIRG